MDSKYSEDSESPEDIPLNLFVSNLLDGKISVDNHSLSVVKSLVDQTMDRPFTKKMKPAEWVRQRASDQTTLQNLLLFIIKSIETDSVEIAEMLHAIFDPNKQYYKNQKQCEDLMEELKSNPEEDPTNTKWRTQLKEGSKVDALDTLNSWFTAQVLECKGDKIKIKFIGFGDQYIESLERSSQRLSAYNTRAIDYSNDPCAKFAIFRGNKWGSVDLVDNVNFFSNNKGFEEMITRINRTDIVIPPIVLCKYAEATCQVIHLLARPFAAKITPFLHPALADAINRYENDALLELDESLVDRIFNAMSEITRVVFPYSVTPLLGKITQMKEMVALKRTNASLKKQLEEKNKYSEKKQQGSGKEENDMSIRNLNNQVQQLKLALKKKEEENLNQVQQLQLSLKKKEEENMELEAKCKSLNKQLQLLKEEMKAGKDDGLELGLDEDDFYSGNEKNSSDDDIYEKTVQHIGIKPFAKKWQQFHHEYTRLLIEHQRFLESMNLEEQQSHQFTLESLDILKERLDRHTNELKTLQIPFDYESMIRELEEHDHISLSKEALKAPTHAIPTDGEFAQIVTQLESYLQKGNPYEELARESLKFARNAQAELKRFPHAVSEIKQITYECVLKPAFRLLQSNLAQLVDNGNNTYLQRKNELDNTERDISEVKQSIDVSNLQDDKKRELVRTRVTLEEKKQKVLEQISLQNQNIRYTITSNSDKELNDFIKRSKEESKLKLGTFMDNHLINQKNALSDLDVLQKILSNEDEKFQKFFETYESERKERELSLAEGQRQRKENLEKLNEIIEQEQVRHEMLASYMQVDTKAKLIYHYSKLRRQWLKEKIAELQKQINLYNEYHKSGETLITQIGQLIDIGLEGVAKRLDEHLQKFQRLQEQYEQEYLEYYKQLNLLLFTKYDKKCRHLSDLKRNLESYYIQRSKADEYDDLSEFDSYGAAIRELEIKKSTVEKEIEEYKTKLSALETNDLKVLLEKYKQEHPSKNYPSIQFTGRAREIAVLAKMEQIRQTPNQEAVAQIQRWRGHGWDPKQVTGGGLSQNQVNVLADPNVSLRLAAPTLGNPLLMAQTGPNPNILNYQGQTEVPNILPPEIKSGRPNVSNTNSDQ